MNISYKHLISRMKGGRCAHWALPFHQSLRNTLKILPTLLGILAPSLNFWSFGTSVFTVELTIFTFYLFLFISYQSFIAFLSRDFWWSNILSFSFSFIALKGSCKTIYEFEVGFLKLAYRGYFCIFASFF